MQEEISFITDEELLRFNLTEKSPEFIYFCDTHMALQLRDVNQSENKRVNMSVSLWLMVEDNY